MNEYALITGASSGIGLAVANELAKSGYNLVLTARRDTRLKKISQELAQKYSVDVSYVVADLKDPNAPKVIYEGCGNKEIAIIINNAGYSINKKFHETEFTEEEDFLRVLSLSMIHLTKLFLPDMMYRGYGRIMIVSSFAALAPPASGWGSLYGPVKTFVNRVGDALNASYNHKGITVTNVCPGFTITEFHQASGLQDAMDKIPAFMKYSSEFVARGAVKATLAGKRIWIPGMVYKFFAVLLRILPTSMILFIARVLRLTGGRYD